MSLCECGCGGDAGVYAWSHPERGALKGAPRRFIHGHNTAWDQTYKIKQGMSINADGTVPTEYRAYESAKRRCTDTTRENWESYGGRGIKFLFTSFEQFFAELGFKPEPKHLYSLDRIDNNGNYEPGNIRWATQKQQLANKRRGVHHKLSIEIAKLLREKFATGEYKMAELARLYNVDWHTAEKAIKGETWKEANL
jgi:hypothetical protein